MALAGKGGSVKFTSSTGGTPALVGDLREWTLNVEADMFDIATFGSSGWREFQPNLNGASGTVSGYWNVEGSTTMKAMQTHLLSQSTDAAEGHAIERDLYPTIHSPTSIPATTILCW